MPQFYQPKVIGVCLEVPRPASMRIVALKDVVAIGKDSDALSGDHGVQVPEIITVFSELQDCASQDLTGGIILKAHR